VRRPIDVRCLLVLLTVAAGLWLPRLRGPLDLRYDAGVYYTLGKSLAEGRGYRLLNEPGAIQAIQYPPLLPAVAALHQIALGTRDPSRVGHALRITMFLLFLGYTAAIFVMSSRLLDRQHAFLVTVLSVVHVQTVFLSDLFAADVPYGFLSVLLFLSGGGMAAAILAVASYALRTAGIALLGAWVAERVLSGRFKQAVARGLVALAAVGAWQTYTTQVKHGPEYAHPAYPYQRADYQFYNVGYLENMSYIDPFRPELGRASAADLARRVWENIRGMPMSLGEGVSAHRGWWRGEIDKLNAAFPGVGLPQWFADATITALSVPVIAGIILLALRGHRTMVIYVAGSILLIALTPWPGQFSRYLVPLTPFLALSFVYVLAMARARAAETGSGWWRGARVALQAAAALIVTQQVYALYKSFTKHHEPAVYVDARGRRHEYRLFFYDRTWRLHDDALDWLAVHADSGAVVATSAPHWAYLRTGLRSIMPPYVAEAGEAERLVEAVPVSDLIVDQLSFIDVGRRYTEPIIRRSPAAWELVYFASDSGPRIYRRVAEGAAGPASNIAASRGTK